MRIFLLSAAAGLMLAPIAASACEYNASALEAVQASAQTVEAVVVGETRAAATQELSAKTKKKKEKVEYMRSAAGPEPAAPKKPKHKKIKKP